MILDPGRPVHTGAASAVPDDLSVVIADWPDHSRGTGAATLHTGHGCDIGERDPRFAPISSGSGPKNGQPVVLTHDGAPTRF